MIECCGADKNQSGGGDKAHLIYIISWYAAPLDLKSHAFNQSNSSALTPVLIYNFR